MKRTLVGIVALVLVVLAARSLWNAVREPKVPADSRTLMDLETGDLFEVSVDALAEGYPYTNPKTGEKTLYPTEVCYANECGNIGGTHVILNELLGKKGPTFCPRCGALVRPHNPRPSQSQAQSD